MEQILIITGAAIFGLLGLAHLLMTFFTHNFDAFDSDVTEAMKGTSPVLTKETSMWNAWIGFNASHSLGAIIVAAVYIPLAAFDMAVISQNIYYSILLAVISLSYLVLAFRYWFKVPFLGIAIATVCILGSLASRLT